MKTYQFLALVLLVIVLIVVKATYDALYCTKWESRQVYVEDCVGSVKGQRRCVGRYETERVCVAHGERK